MQRYYLRYWLWRSIRPHFEIDRKDEFEMCRFPDAVFRTSHNWKGGRDESMVNTKEKDLAGRVWDYVSWDQFKLHLAETRKISTNLTNHYYYMVFRFTSKEQANDFLRHWGRAKK